MNDLKLNWEKLGIANDFLFGKVMRDPELCKELLERILPDLKIDHIEYPELQKSINLDADARSVRLDVYIRDENDTVYDIEMQTTDTRELPKRSRYYQSMIDLQMIDKGQSYKELNRSYVIFICLTDIFHKGRHKYTFQNNCKEDQSISLEDGSTKIFLNAEGIMQDVSKELKAFLDYVSGKKSEDSFVRKLEEAVNEAKKNREWRHEYMTLLMRDQENYEKGIEIGLEKGKEIGLEKGKEIGLELGLIKGEVKGMIKAYKEVCLPEETIIKKITEKYSLPEVEIRKYFEDDI